MNDEVILDEEYRLRIARKECVKTYRLWNTQGVKRNQKTLWMQQRFDGKQYKKIHSQVDLELNGRREQRTLKAED